MTDMIGIALAVLGALNLLGVSGLYYRLGGAMASQSHVQKRQDQQHDDHAKLASRVTLLERNQMKANIPC